MPSMPPLSNDIHRKDRLVSDQVWTRQDIWEVPSKSCPLAAPTSQVFPGRIRGTVNSECPSVQLPPCKIPASAQSSLGVLKFTESETARFTSDRILYHPNKYKHTHTQNSPDTLNISRTSNYCTITGTYSHKSFIKHHKFTQWAGKQI